MTPAAAALIAAALALPFQVHAAAKALPRQAGASAVATAAPESPRPESPRPASPRPEAVARVADWVAASKDNGPLPYIVVDKQSARLFVFDAKGQARGQAPILIGLTIGDTATPGVGAKTLAQLGPAEKTTPAGRFLARYGLAAGNQRVLWVDYGTSVALHPMPPGTRRERRRARLDSPAPDDNRITFGCINVPPAFYAKSVRPLFRRKGGVIYVLPDTLPMEEVFPRLRVEPYLRRDPAEAPQA